MYFDHAYQLLLPQNLSYHPLFKNDKSIPDYTANVLQDVELSSATQQAYKEHSLKENYSPSSSIHIFMGTIAAFICITSIRNF